MGEGVRLKKWFFLSQNLIQQQSNQSQHPQQRMEAEKLLKETSTSNNIEDNIMDASQQIVLDYLLSSKMGEINDNKIKIGDKTYNFERNTPITDRLKRKFNKIRQTMDYKRYELKEKRDIRWTNLDKDKALTGIQKRYKATITDEQSAFGNYVNSFSISNIKLQGVKALQYLKYQEDKLKSFLQQNRGMKIALEVFGTYRSKKTGEEIRHTTRSRRYEVTNAEDLPKVLSQMATDIEIQMDKMELSESGLVIKQIDKLTFNYDKYNPTRGGSFIALPKWVQNKKACINIKNTDNMCFKYSVQCGVYKIYEKDHGCDMYHYKKIEDTLNWTNINFPSSNVDIDTLEQNNEGVVSINVYALDEEDGKESVVLYRKTEVVRATHHIDLLKLQDGDNYHYVFVKDYNRLIGSQTNKKKIKKFHCRRCLHGFGSEDLLKQHEKVGCLAVEGQKVEMRFESIDFQNHYKKLRDPFAIYADFECLTTKHGSVKTKIQNTDTYQHHRPCGFMLNLVSSIDGSSKPFLYRGEDCRDVFVKKIIDIKNDVLKIMYDKKDIIVTADDWRDFKTAKKCYICGKEYKEDDKPVRDHCHFTGQYRGSAHNDCNLRFCLRYYRIPVFLHNLKNYDAHLIIERAHQLAEQADINVIAQNSEKFITFSFKNLCFKDSFSFLSASLDKLVRLTKYEDRKKRENWEEKFKYSKRNPYVKTTKDLDLLTDKGVYPYDYFDSFDKFRERQLPPKEAFYSRLTETDIDEEEYERAVEIWEHFGIRTLGQYHDLYLRTDVLLLTDIFKNFRDLCLEYYKLDPAHYFTLPNFAWDAMLLKTNIIIKPIRDQEMYEMIERGLRGGMCQVSRKEAKANNKHMGEDYDETKPSNYITYLDANNLYGHAMSQKLPTGELDWTKKVPNVMDWQDNDNFGYILEVDLEYPKELHDEHSDYPLAPENMNVLEQYLSDHKRELFRHYYNGKEPKDEKTPKLVLNLLDKERYVIHIKALKFYLEKGLKVKQYHGIIKFQQRAWLKTWIDFNTEKRKEAKSNFEKDLFKLMNNAVYGKTMENVRNHMDFELVHTKERMQKCINNPNYKARHIINEELVGVEKIKTHLVLDKPIYLGMSILDLSKHHMYSFYYDILKKKYGKNIRLIWHRQLCFGNAHGGYLQRLEGHKGTYELLRLWQKPPNIRPNKQKGTG